MIEFFSEPINELFFFVLHDVNTFEPFGEAFGTEVVTVEGTGAVRGFDFKGVR